MKARLIFLVGLITCNLCAEQKVEPNVAIPAKLRFLSYEINSNGVVKLLGISAKGRTCFVKLGDQIPNTQLQVQQFKQKTHPNADGTIADDSELTLIHLQTRNPFVLTLDKSTEDPSIK